MTAPAIALTSTFADNTTSISFTGTPAIGDLLIVLSSNSGATTPSYTDNATGGTNSYSTQCHAYDSSGNNTVTITSSIITRTVSGLTITAAGSAGASYQAFTIHSSTGTPTIDGTPVAAYTDPTTYASYSLAMGSLTGTADLLLAICQPNNAEAVTPTSGWSVLSDNHSNYFYAMQQTTSSAGSYSATASISIADIWTMAAIAITNPSVAAGAIIAWIS